ncbi:MAG: N-acetylmuramoyl-L-alanine amidase family protein [Henriciella sp.]|nr:N-acetylmuramoyl-L-alanine amidase [Hyphomonadaceae bacterium]
MTLSAAGWAQVQSVGVAGDGEFTRITITSESPMRPDIFLRDTEEAGLVIEMVPADFRLTHAPFFAEPTGGISAYVLETDRIVFELDRPMMVMREIDLPPSGTERLYRYILDLSGVSEARFQSAARRDAQRFARFEAERYARAEADLLNPPVLAETEPAMADLPESPSSKPAGFGALINMAARQRRVIVIDPGHGGRDPGALAVIGGKESEIVLKTSLKLKDMIEQDPRYVVRLTRETDVYVEHEDRVTKARNWGADLFISVHADAAGAPTVKGASVYTLSTRGEARIEGTAKKFGWNLPIEDGTSEEVSDILQDLTVRETKSNSAIFAEFLVPELGQAGPLLRNTHRRQNLFVLLAPDVPAVLIEIGFLTNKDDAKRLKTERGRRKSAAAIKRAIDAYFDRQDLLIATN